MANPLILGELYQVSNPEDQDTIDELRSKIQTALEYLKALIDALDARVTTLEGP